MSYQEIFYPESRFGGFTDVDGTVAFYTRVNAILKPSFTLLDVGCGRGAYADDPFALRRNLRIFKGKVEKVVGLDVDEAARDNEFLDEFHLLTGDVWPIEDDGIDLIVCDNVLEHVETPDAFFSQCRRVLRNGGYLCIRTPNVWGYPAIFSRLIPNRYHARVTRVVQKDRKEEDVFPTVYRCNSLRRIRAKLRQFGFDGVAYGFESEPCYLSFSVVAYWLGVLHQRFAPRCFGSAIFAFAQLRKP